MSKRKNTIIIICFIIVILLGAGAAAYPLIASINNEHTQSLVQTEYEEKLQQIDTSEIDAALAAAREYNKTISTVQIENIDKIKADLPPYEDLLNLANNGIMGYIMIPVIYTTARPVRRWKRARVTWKARRCRWAVSAHTP